MWADYLLIAILPGFMDKDPLPGLCMEHWQAKWPRDGRSRGQSFEWPDFSSLVISAAWDGFNIGISAPWVLKNEKSVADHIFSSQRHLFEDPKLQK